MQSTTQLKHETAGESFSGLAGAALHDRVIHWCLGRGALGSQLTAVNCMAILAFHWLFCPPTFAALYTVALSVKYYR